MSGGSATTAETVTEKAKSKSSETTTSVESTTATTTTTTRPEENGPVATSPEEDEEEKGPRAVQVVSIGTAENEYAFTFHEEAFNEVLSKVPPGWKVAVVSVVGAFRTGKSFLLSWFLQYLQYHHGGNRPQEDEDDKKTPTTPRWFETIDSVGNHSGFDWRGGSERNTTGIWIWSEPYFVHNAETSKEDLAVLLVDTQGMFDHETTMELTASIFGLSTLLSSYQIYNVDKRIQEDHLQQLALFSEYGHAAIRKEDSTKSSKGREKTTSKPFQLIEFLVRDWQNFHSLDEDDDDDEDDEEEEEEDEQAKKYLRSDTLDKLEEEMRAYLEQVLTLRDAKDLKETREQILSCFEKISCFQMVHPGFAVTKKKYTGSVKLMEPIFLSLLDRLCRRVFGNLAPKKIHGRSLTAVELGTYVKAYAQLFQGGAHFPTASTLLEATAQANNTNAKTLSLEKYKSSMNLMAGLESTSYLQPEELQRAHNSTLAEALDYFDDLANFGNTTQIEKTRSAVLLQIKDDFEIFRKLNENRNPLAGLETFIVPVTVAIVSYSLRLVTDSTCSSWSDTCRMGSDLLSHIYSVVLFFLLIVGFTKAQQLREAYGRILATLQALLGVTPEPKTAAAPPAPAPAAAATKPPAKPPAKPATTTNETAEKKE